MSAGKENGSGVDAPRLVEQSRVAAMFFCGIERGEASGHSLRYYAKKTTHSLRPLGIRITAVTSSSKVCAHAR